MYHSPTRHAPLIQVETGTFPNQGNWTDHIKRKDCKSNGLLLIANQWAAEDSCSGEEFTKAVNYPVAFPHPLVPFGCVHLPEVLLSFFKMGPTLIQSLKPELHSCSLHSSTGSHPRTYGVCFRDLWGSRRLGVFFCLRRHLRAALREEPCRVTDLALGFKINKSIKWINKS